MSKNANQTIHIRNFSHQKTLKKTIYQFKNDKVVKDAFNLIFIWVLKCYIINITYKSILLL